MKYCELRRYFELYHQDMITRATLISKIQIWQSHGSQL